MAVAAQDAVLEAELGAAERAEEAALLADVEMPSVSDSDDSDDSDVDSPLLEGELPPRIVRSELHTTDAEGRSAS